MIFQVLDRCFFRIELLLELGALLGAGVRHFLLDVRLVGDELRELRLESGRFVGLDLHRVTADADGKYERHADADRDVGELLFALVLLDGGEVLLVRLLLSQLLEARRVFRVEASFFDLGMTNRLEASGFLALPLLGLTTLLLGRGHAGFFFFAGLALRIQTRLDHGLLLPLALVFFLLDSVLLKVHELLE